MNPAIDRIISVDRLAFEDRAYINSSRESAGGRGINASCVIHSFGGDTTAVFTSGGASGKRLEELHKGCGYRILVVPIENEIRTNLTITDTHGLTVNLNEAGPELSKAELARLEKVIRGTLDGAAWLMLCGSLPPGVPPSFYAKLIAMARQKKVKTLLHADGRCAAGRHRSQTHGGDAQPAGGRAAAGPHASDAHALSGGRGRGSAPWGPESVVLSLGSRGAIGAFADGLVEALPPRVDAVCPIGAGDALDGGLHLVDAPARPSPADALRWGVAAGTASARLPGMKFATLQQTQEIYRQVEVRRAE